MTERKPYMWEVKCLLPGDKVVATVHYSHKTKNGTMVHTFASTEHDDTPTALTWVNEELTHGKENI